MYTNAMDNLVGELKRLPGVGQRTAERLAQHLLKTSQEEALQLAQAIRELKERVRPCSVCFHVTEADPCPICRDPKRDRHTVCVVEQPRDLVLIEESGAYRGLYHILTGALNPLEGTRPEDLTVEALHHRVQRDGIQEVILATNPTLEGDASAMLVQERLAGLGVQLTRLARGVPTGSSLAYQNKASLQDALEGRRPLP